MKRTPQQPRQIVYPFPLRPDFLVSLTLPVDLTPDEAEKLGAFVRTLALPRPAPGEETQDQDENR